MILAVFSSWRRFGAVLLLTVLGVLFVSGVGVDMLRPVGMGHLQDGCRQYLDESQSKAFTTFLTLSVVKSGLAILEGSSANLSLLGSGLDVEVGDIVQSSYDTIDFAWRVMLVSYLALFLAEVLVMLGEVAGGFLLGLACLVGAAFLVLSRRDTGGRWLRLLGRVLSVLLVLAVTLYLLLPLSLLIGSSLSDGIVEPIRSENQQALEELNRKINIFQGSVTGWPGKAKDLLESIGDLVETIAEGLLRMSVAYIVDVIVVPLGLVLALYWLMRTMLRSILGRTDSERFERAARKAMETVLKGSRGSGPSGE